MGVNGVHPSLERSKFSAKFLASFSLSLVIACRILEGLDLGEQLIMCR